MENMVDKIKNECYKYNSEIIELYLQLQASLNRNDMKKAHKIHKEIDLRQEAIDNLFGKLKNNLMLNNEDTLLNKRMNTIHYTSDDDNSLDNNSICNTCNKI